MKSSSKRTIFISLAFLMFASSFLIYSYFITPVYAEIINLRAKLISLDNAYNNYKSLEKQFSDILSDYNGSADSNKLSLIFPANLNVSYSLSQVVGLAKLNNLSVESLSVRELAIRPSTENLVKNLGTLRMEFKTSGNYYNLKSFFQDLENNILILKPISLAVENQTGGQLNYSIVVDSYYQAAGMPARRQ